VGLRLQRKDGSFPAGRNGPWGDDDTPVRNTANWLKTFLFSYQQTNDNRFLNASNEALLYLLSGITRPYSLTFLCRTNRNECNGLIGQAWVLGGLEYYHRLFKVPKVLTVIKNNLCSHKFDEGRGLWYELNIDGSPRRICSTFNQQLCFSLVTFAAQRKRFIEKLDKNFSIYRSGLIKHVITGRQRKRRAVGYHSFNLYGFALLKEAYPNLPLWQSKKFQKALTYAQSPAYKKAIDKSPYGYPYNMTGIEIAYALYAFTGILHKEWIVEQFRRHFDFETFLMSKNTSDPETLQARIYEAIRLPDVKIEI